MAKSKKVEEASENKIILGTPILKNLLNDNEPVSSCTIVPVDLRKDINNLKAI